MSQNDELLNCLKETLEMLRIYYVPNSDGSTPTITRAEAVIADAEATAVAKSARPPHLFRRIEVETIRDLLANLPKDATVELRNDQIVLHLSDKEIVHVF